MVGVAAAVTRHDAGVLAALPSLVGAAVAVPVLRYLLTAWPAARRPGSQRRRSGELATVGAPQGDRAGG